MNKGLIVVVQTVLELLQTVISDVLAIVGGPSHKFIIDHDSKLAEKLWLAQDLRELRLSDKLLKLCVELTCAHLCKLEQLHQGESLSTARTAPGTLHSPTPHLSSMPTSTGCGMNPTSQLKTSPGEQWRINTGQRKWTMWDPSPLCRPQLCHKELQKKSVVGIFPLCVSRMLQQMWHYFPPQIRSNDLPACLTARAPPEALSTIR
jgi:hypothetical protein